MTNSAKVKGDRAEREVERLLPELVGVAVRRALGAGRRDDRGDIFGLPDTALQVAAWADLDRAVREKLPELELQMSHAGARFGALFCRRRGGHFVVIMTPEMWAEYWKEAVA